MAHNHKHLYHLPWPCPTGHPRTTLYEVTVKCLSSRCGEVSCLIYGLTAAEMRDAWRKMRSVTVIGSFAGNVAAPATRKENSKEGRGRRTREMAEGEKPKNKKKKVHWGGVEIIHFEDEGTSDIDSDGIV